MPVSTTPALLHSHAQQLARTELHLPVLLLPSLPPSPPLSLAQSLKVKASAQHSS